MPSKSSNSKSKTKTNEKDISFEEAIVELEKITHRLESGQESLEKSMQLYERGMELKTICEKKIHDAQGQWKILRKNSTGSVVLEDMQNQD